MPCCGGVEACTAGSRRAIWSRRDRRGGLAWRCTVGTPRRRHLEPSSASRSATAAGSTPNRSPAFSHLSASSSKPDRGTSSPDQTTPSAEEPFGVVFGAGGPPSPCRSPRRGDQSHPSRLALSPLTAGGCFLRCRQAGSFGGKGLAIQRRAPRHPRSCSYVIGCASAHVHEGCTPQMSSGRSPSSTIRTASHLNSRGTGPCAVSALGISDLSGDGANRIVGGTAPADEVGEGKAAAGWAVLSRSSASHPRQCRKAFRAPPAATSDGLPRSMSGTSQSALRDVSRETSLDSHHGDERSPGFLFPAA